jgi:hypothetical protein
MPLYILRQSSDNQRAEKSRKQNELHIADGFFRNIFSNIEAEFEK